MQKKKLSASTIFFLIASALFIVSAVVCLIVIPETIIDYQNPPAIDILHLLNQFWEIYLLPFLAIILIALIYNYVLLYPKRVHFLSNLNLIDVIFLIFAFFAILIALAAGSILLQAQQSPSFNALLIAFLCMVLPIVLFLKNPLHKKRLFISLMDLFLAVGILFIAVAIVRIISDTKYLSSPYFILLLSAIFMLIVGLLFFVLLMLSKFTLLSYIRYLLLESSRLLGKLYRFLNSALRAQAVRLADVTILVWLIDRLSNLLTTSAELGKISTINGTISKATYFSTRYAESAPLSGPSSGIILNVTSTDAAPVYYFWSSSGDNFFYALSASILNTIWFQWEKILIIWFFLELLRFAWNASQQLVIEDSNYVSTSDQDKGEDIKWRRIICRGKECS